MRGLIALTTVVAALGVGATSATAAPPSALDQGAKLCERQGGDVGVFGPIYQCVNSNGDFKDRDFSQAARVCSRNGGIFFAQAAHAYLCELV